MLPVSKTEPDADMESMSIADHLAELQSLIREVGPPPSKAAPWSEEQKARYRAWLAEKTRRRAWLGLPE